MWILWKIRDLARQQTHTHTENRVFVHKTFRIKLHIYLQGVSHIYIPLTFFICLRKWFNLDRGDFFETIFKRLQKTNNWAIVSWIEIISFACDFYKIYLKMLLFYDEKKAHFSFCLRKHIKKTLANDFHFW